MSDERAVPNFDNASHYSSVSYARASNNGLMVLVH